MYTFTVEDESFFESLSVRRAWIEIRKVKLLPEEIIVALREEGVD